MAATMSTLTGMSNDLRGLSCMFHDIHEQAASRGVYEATATTKEPYTYKNGAGEEIKVDGYTTNEFLTAMEKLENAIAGAVAVLSSKIIEKREVLNKAEASRHNATMGHLVSILENIGNTLRKESPMGSPEEDEAKRSEVLEGVGIT